AGDGSDTEVHVSPTLTTYLGQNVTANVTHDLQVVATSSAAEAHATANTYGGGAVAVGAPTTTAVNSPTLPSSVDLGSTLTVGGNLNVKALAHDDANPATSNLTDFVQDVNSSNDSIKFSAYGLQNGDLVTYVPSSPTDAIQTPTATGYLQQYETDANGNVIKNTAGNPIVRTYHVLQVVKSDGTIDPNNFQLGSAFNGGQIDAGNVFATGSGVDPTQNVIRFSTPHGFETGDAVHYA